MTVFTHKIDWRRQFDDLETYLDGDRGGVAEVRYADPACAPVAFIQTLTVEYEQGGSPGKFESIRLDPDNFNTHFLGDIRETFRFKLGVSSEAAIPGTIKAGTDNHAGGDQEINLTFNIHGDEAAQARQRSRWADELVTFLDGFLDRGRRLMIILTDDPEKEHAQFWQHLWRGRLERLKPKGIFLVRMRGPRPQAWSDHPDAPRADTVIVLPANLGHPDLGHAVEDAAEVLRKEVSSLTAASAHDMAKAVVYVQSESVQAMRNGVAGLIAKLSTEIPA